MSALIGVMLCVAAVGLGSVLLGVLAVGYLVVRVLDVLVEAEEELG